MHPVLCRRQVIRLIRQDKTRRPVDSGGALVSERLYGPKKARAALELRGQRKGLRSWSHGECAEHGLRSRSRLSGCADRRLGIVAKVKRQKIQVPKCIRLIDKVSLV